eukprot:gene619-678_t
MELSLLSGDLSVIEADDSLLIQEIDAVTRQGGSWNPSLYNEQLKRELKLQSVFNFGQKGTDKMIAQPTKVQNRKHHINSLALHAAEMELELLDARGARNKTKSETQA